MSASDSSEISVNKSESTDINGQLATSQSVLNDDKYWWNTQSSSDESDNSKEALKNGTAWLKSDTKSGGQSIIQSSGDRESQLSVSTENAATKQPSVSPVTTGVSHSSSGEDFTHDSLGAF